MILDITLYLTLKCFPRTTVFEMPTTKALETQFLVQYCFYSVPARKVSKLLTPPQPMNILDSSCLYQFLFLHCFVLRCDQGRHWSLRWSSLLEFFPFSLCFPDSPSDPQIHCLQALLYASQTNKSENFGLPPASITLPAHSAHFPLNKREVFCSTPLRCLSGLSRRHNPDPYP